MNKIKENLEIVSIGKIIKELSVSKSIKASQIGEYLGVSKQAVYDIFKKDSIDSKLILAFSELFDVPVDYLLKWKGNRQQDNKIRTSTAKVIGRGSGHNTGSRSIAESDAPYMRNKGFKEYVEVEFEDLCGKCIEKDEQIKFLEGVIISLREGLSDKQTIIENLRGKSETPNKRTCSY